MRAPPAACSLCPAVATFPLPSPLAARLLTIPLKCEINFRSFGLRPASRPPVVLFRLIRPPTLVKHLDGWQKKSQPTGHGGGLAHLAKTRRLIMRSTRLAS